MDQGIKIQVSKTGYFPILRSILAAEALAGVIEDAYGLTNVRCRLIKAVILDTYLVQSAAGLHIWRVYPAQRRTLAEIRAELEWLHYLQDQGAAVSVPLPQANGDYLLALPAPEGARYAALFTYAEGEPLSQHQEPSAVRAYGRALAEVHAIADSLPRLLARPTLDLEWLIERPLEELAQLWGRDSEKWLYLRGVADRLQPVIAALPLSAPHYGLCHGDAGSANAHVAANGNLTLFDFDFCGYGWRAYDIGTFLSGEPAEITQAFLTGYQTVRSLAQDELDTLPAFQTAQSIWMLGTRASYINEWGTTHFTERFVTHVPDFIKRVIEQGGINNI
jgi:Ser/Thr protein kinase RdoA (MazF antagonist)